MDLYSRGKIDHTMLPVIICEKFGWTYEEYLAQPNFFIKLAQEKFRIDGKEQDLNMRKAKHG